MKIPKYICRIIITIIATFNFIFSFEAKEKLTCYTVNEGLSQHSVTSIVQDSNNMLWVGTFDGLNMFDGETFQVFRHYPEDPESVLDNRIINLAFDQNDGLWILYANNHVGKYLGDGKFQNYELPEGMDNWENVIKSMIVCDHHLIITNHKGIVIIFNPDNVKESERIHELRLFLDQIKQRNELAISIDIQNDRIWISTEKGLYCSNGHHQFKMNSNLNNYKLKVAGERYILLWKQSELVICSNISENTKFHVIEKYSFDANIQSAVIGTDEEFWVGTLGGYKIRDSKISCYPPYSPVRILFCDNLGMVWSGSLNGLESINSYSQPIDNFKFVNEDFSLQNHVNSIFVSPLNNDIWVGIKYGGLHLLTAEKSENDGYKLSPKKYFFQNENVTMVSQYSKDTVVVGTSEGLQMLVKMNNKYISAPLGDRKEWKPQMYRAIKFNDKLWISNGKKLICLSFSKGKSVIDKLSAINDLLPNKSVITSIIADPIDSALLIGYRGDGIYKIYPKTGKVCNFGEMINWDLSNRYIWDIYFDRSKKLWIGTDTGLNHLYKDAKGAFHLLTLSVKDGMRNDKIETIEEDLEGNIWLGTSQGIVCYNPLNKTFHTYDHEDGFQSNNFNSASGSLADGTLLFGGINGISVFNPITFRRTKIKPSMIIKYIMSNDKIIDRKKWDDIILQSKDKNIRIKLSSYYPINQNKIRYRYSINGGLYNEISGNEIILTDLSPNKYDISISCYTEQGNESPDTHIHFTIKRPFLLSKGAFFIYIIILSITTFLILRNVLTRKMLDNKLKMEKQLRVREVEMNTEKLNFYMSIAHEIKTPLSLIIGRIYNIENSGLASPYVIHETKLIGDNVQIIKELTEQIIDFKKAVTGKLKLKIQKQDIMPCIREIVNNYRDYAEQHGIILRLQSSNNIIIKRIDQRKIVRILYNLLSNAIKFSERDDIVNIKVVNKPDCLTLVISDTGVGISEEDLPHIFEKFYTKGKAGGSGIGLAFTKSLVELMGGTITVNSTYGKGTVFIVVIPDGTKEDENRDVLDAKKEASRSIETLNEIRNDIIPAILLIEDNIDLNEYLTEILSIRFKIHQSYNGKEAMNILKREQIDLIISDIMLPGSSGIEIVQKIKANKNTAHIPILFMSAKTDWKDQLEGLKVGAIDYITKPFNPNILLVKIQNILSQYFLSKVNFANTKIDMHKEVPVINRDEIFINKARKIIYKNIAEETFGVNSLSHEMGMSRVHLTREFQRIISRSPSSFIKSIRLNYAKHLLSSGEYSIKEMLWEIGIRSHSGFTKAFKKEFGYLPSQQKEHIDKTNQNIKINEN